MPCTYYSKAIFVSISTCRCVQLKSCCRKLLIPSISVTLWSFSDSIHTVHFSNRSGSNSPALKVRQMKCGLLSWGEIHLPHWLSLLMARERKGWRRKWCVGVSEGHSRPAALRAEEPGSASLQTEPVLFLGGQTPRRHDCAPCISNLRSFRERSAY